MIPTQDIWALKSAVKKSGACVYVWAVIGETRVSSMGPGYAKKVGDPYPPPVRTPVGVFAEVYKKTFLDMLMGLPDNAFCSFRVATDTGAVFVRHVGGDS